MWWSPSPGSALRTGLAVQKTPGLIHRKWWNKDRTSAENLQHKQERIGVKAPCVSHHPSSHLHDYDNHKILFMCHGCGGNTTKTTETMIIITATTLLHYDKMMMMMMMMMIVMIMMVMMGTTTTMMLMMVMMMATTTTTVIIRYPSTRPQTFIALGGNGAERQECRANTVVIANAIPADSWQRNIMLLACTDNDHNWL